MVGGQVLKLLLERTAVEKVVSIGRRNTSATHPKLHEIVHADFLDLSAVEPDLTGVEVCFYCLGVYQGQVSKDAYLEITCDYQKALTDVLSEVSPRATFVLFGAQGADPTEKSPALFARSKGRAENLLNQTDFPKKYIFRPGYIHPTGARRPPGMAYTLLRPIAGLLLSLFPSFGLTDRQLAQAMVTAGLDATMGSGIFSNKTIRALAADA